MTTSEKERQWIFKATSHLNIALRRLVRRHDLADPTVERAFKMYRKALEGFDPGYGGGCYACDAVDQGYMLTRSAWAQVNAFYDVPQEKLLADGRLGRYLCLDCVAVALGRPLKASDLIDFPINRALRWALERTTTEPSAPSA